MRDPQRAAEDLAELGLGEDPDEYRVECSCGQEFSSWGKATRHVEEEH